MQKITPFLWFDDQAEEAVNYYAAIFKDSKVGTITHLGDDVPGPKGKVITITFQLAGMEFMALNGGPEFTFTPAVSFFVLCETEAEVDALWKQLSVGGKALMALDKYPFSEKFGWVQDRFGISWQLSLSGQAQKIAPFLMFVGEQHGNAQEAINFYTSLFKNSNIITVALYDPGQGEPEGAISHAMFTLNGQAFMAMESNQAHAFTFTPAISFFVNCESQAEVDEFWKRLTADGGKEGQCGWLEDKYGVSWQIVPTILGQLMGDPDPEKARRVTQAMLQMKKLDVRLLKQAYEGE